jgi:hypothetical protein
MRHIEGLYALQTRMLIQGHFTGNTLLTAPRWLLGAIYHLWKLCSVYQQHLFIPDFASLFLYASSLSPEIIVILLLTSVIITIILSSTIVLPIIATSQENVSSTSITIPKWKIAISSGENLKSVGRTLSSEGRHINTTVDPDTHHGPVAAY